VQVSVEFLVEDTDEKMLLPGDLDREDSSSDEYVNSEYVLTGIHQNGQ
jgi:hypothetical protein